MCRADIIDQIPQEILDEAAPDAEQQQHVMTNSRVDDDGYGSADEVEEDATHIKIRYGAREIGFLRNDGVPKTITYDDGTVSFRIEYRHNKCYLIRKDYPDTPVPLNPLASMCAVLAPSPPIPSVE